ncbi:MAG TPA: hypothetical protein VF760_12150, partial [Xanthobacteraceae bacterium]
QGSDGNWGIDGASVQFQPIDGSIPNIITGVFLASALTAGSLLASLALPSPGVPLNDANGALIVLPRFCFDVTANYGDVETDF